MNGIREARANRIGCDLIAWGLLQSVTLTTDRPVRMGYSPLNQHTTRRDLHDNQVHAAGEKDCGEVRGNMKQHKKIGESFE